MYNTYTHILFVLRHFVRDYYNIDYSFCQEEFIGKEKLLRTILHCDLNSFYASVELFLNPNLKGLPVAVCGSKEDRHGIVLAKTDEAKKYGVKTAETIWEAQRKCPQLIIIPPHHDEYVNFSQRVRRIYEEYTDLVEPFGIDECWLDVTGSERLFGSGEEIANKIRERVKKEVGVTISVGVSFNKVFAKLGSDMKKPDAVTIIPFSSFKDIIYNLPATDMIGVGPNMGKALSNYCINTIGELAATDKNFLIKKFGKAGECIWAYANGFDSSPVSHINYHAPVKSIGRGTTQPVDLKNNDEVHKVIVEMSQIVSHKLRKNGLKACGVQLSVKDSNLSVKQFQAPLPIPTQCFYFIAEKAFELFVHNYYWNNNVRSVTVRAINLSEYEEPEQLDMLQDYNTHEKINNAEEAIEKIRNKYGIDSVGVARNI